VPALNDDGTMDWGVDLGAMSAEKEKLVVGVDSHNDHDCEHPLTSHTGTEATYPWKICAHVPCGCQILED
jgi:hypothetical protein